MALNKQIQQVYINGDNFARGNSFVTNYAVSTTTDVNVSTDRITVTTAPPVNGTVLNFKEDSTITSVGGLTLGSNYFVVDSGGGGGNDFKLSSTLNGSAIDLTGTVTGSGGDMFRSSDTFIINIQNSIIRLKEEFWNNNEFDQAIGGFRRSNFRGFRVSYDYEYEQSLQPSIIRDLYNDIYWELVTNSGNSIKISMDSGNNYNDVIPQDLDYLMSYSNTIGSFVPTIRMVCQNILTSIPPNLQFQ